MLKWIGTTALMSACFVAGTLVPVVHSQAQQSQQTPPAQGPYYVMVNYMKTKPQKEGEYVRLELQFWKAAHAVRIKAGQRRFWSLMQPFPIPSGHDYDYVTVTGFHTLQDIEGAFAGFPAAFKEAFPKMTPEDITKQVRTTLESRDMLRSEIFRVIDEVR